MCEKLRKANLLVMKFKLEDEPVETAILLESMEKDSCKH